MSAVLDPRALDAAAMNARADRRRKRKSSSVRLAILAAASRVRCAALREWIGKAKPPERGKEAALAGVSNCQRDKHCDDAGLLHQAVAECNAALGYSGVRAAWVWHGPTDGKQASYADDKGAARSRA